MFIRVGVKHPFLLLSTPNCRLLEKSSIEVVSLEGVSFFRQENISDKTHINLSEYPVGTNVLKINLGEEKNIWKVIEK